MTGVTNISEIAAGLKNVRRLTAKPWRAVEAQYKVVTRKLVDSLEEQFLLEELLESRKPAYHQDSDEHLHYLLSTPFRYPPLKFGSRFGTRLQRGIWYGSARVKTALSEVAYYRFLFLEGTDADLGTVYTDFTVFRASIKTSRGIDLTREPFLKLKSRFIDSSDYRRTQELGTNMRDANIHAFRYFSARDKDNGINIAVLNGLAFEQKRPLESMHWHCIANLNQVEFLSQDILKRSQLKFTRNYFD